MVNIHVYIYGSIQKTGEEIGDVLEDEYRDVFMFRRCYPGRLKDGWSDDVVPGVAIRTMALRHRGDVTTWPFALALYAESHIYRDLPGHGIKQLRAEALELKRPYSVIEDFVSRIGIQRFSHQA